MIHANRMVHNYDHQILSNNSCYPIVTNEPATIVADHHVWLMLNGCPRKQLMAIMINIVINSN